MTRRVRKAVIPAAGLGTRFLPATKAQPKEMLTIVDKPAIQYVVEEAVAAGLDEVLIITSTTKGAIEDHFDRSGELERALADSGKFAERDNLVSIAEMATFHFTRQGEPRGLGHAVLMAEAFAGDEPFVVLLPDQLNSLTNATLPTMIETYDEQHASVVALHEVAHEAVHRYGCAAVDPVSGATVRIPFIIEKPSPDVAPSNLVVKGRYLFTPEIFEHLHRTCAGVGGEIQLTDAMAKLAEGSRLFGVIDDCGGWDTGQKLDFLRAQVELGLQHPDLGEDFEAVLRDVMKNR